MLYIYKENIPVQNLFDQFAKKNDTQEIYFEFPSKRLADKSLHKLLITKTWTTITCRCSQNSLHKDVCPTHHSHPTTLVNNHFLLHLLEYVKQTVYNFFIGLTQVHFHISEISTAYSNYTLNFHN